MVITEDKLKETENRIIKYYENIEKIDMFISRIEQLSKLWERTSDQIKIAYQKLDWSEAVDLKAVTYDGVRVQGGALPASPMERILSGPSEGILKQAEEIEFEIKQKQDLILQLGFENSILEDTLKKLDTYSRRFIELKYKMKLSYEAMEFELNMSKSNICRRKKQILVSVTKYIEWVYCEI